MISNPLYNDYLTLLLEGKRIECTRILQRLLDQDGPIKIIYKDVNCVPLPKCPIWKTSEDCWTNASKLHEDFPAN